MLTVIGPGGARFRMVSWEEATAIVRRCYDLGINYYDCSRNYWGGRSEEVYGAVSPQTVVPQQIRSTEETE
ncbi:MAG: aldo/keto reductase [Caldilineaceae bacterium]